MATVENDLSRMGHRALKSRIKKERKTISRLARLDDAEVVRQRRGDEVIGKMRAASKTINAAEAELTRRQSESFTRGLPSSRARRDEADNRARSKKKRK